MTVDQLPLGATWDGSGVHFSLFSAHAQSIVLCLFDSPAATKEQQSIPLEEGNGHIWSVYVPGCRPGQLYGYRVSGAYEPKKGHRFNPHKVLLDPYAKAIGRTVNWHPSLFAYDQAGSEDDDLYLDASDNAAHCPLAAVAEPLAVENRTAAPKVPWEHTIIYEAHVKGMTQLHPEVPEELRGTYAGLGSDAILSHLLKLGVTAIELLPIQYHVDESHLREKGLTNYWGYSSLGYFAIDPRFAASKDPLQVRNEFRQMVERFHSAGIEVILDVVYNHTCEGNQMGPTLSFRGIDNASYYRLDPQDLRYHTDYTGCGNTVNTAHPQVLELVLDSLRYWTSEFGIDGFRFDLATVLGREEHWMNPEAAFFTAVAADPILSQVKLIAEPWDLGEGGYQLGHFPAGWAEWNGRFRDKVRGFWTSAPRAVGGLATSLTGSSDLFSHNNRPPQASINFVTCHDGFTLRDLVAYNRKHNEANGEENRDGRDDNRSWNCGVEGETEDEAINALRLRQRKNIVSSLFLSTGVPMLLAGDELGRSQHGNNNTYCQDNELNWLAWELSKEDRQFFDFVRWLISFRKSHSIFSRSTFFQGTPLEPNGLKDVSWWLPNGSEMTEEDWGRPKLRQLAAVFADGRFGELRGEVQHYPIALWCNAGPAAELFLLPKPLRSRIWKVVLDTADPTTPEQQRSLSAAKYRLEPHSFVVLRACEFE